MTQRLRITEVFYSIQGESNTVGFPTLFIRLTGCPLRCQYCDTAYAFSGGRLKALDDILAEVKRYSVRFVTVTGGEPLAQPNVLPLLTQLCDEGYQVSLETSGALDITPVDARVSRVVDIKTPASGESDKNLWSNMDRLGSNDLVKFVICNQVDFEWAKDVIHQHRLLEKCEVLVSPSFGQVPAKMLAEWVLESQLPIRFQIQLHKHLWGDEQGR